MLRRINTELLPIKAHYFLFHAATGPIVQFLPVIGRQLGFTPFVLGKIYMILPIAGLIAKPLFGALADKFRLHKTFFIFFQALLALAFFPIYFIPAIEPAGEIKLTCEGETFLEVCLPRNYPYSSIQSIIDGNDTTFSCDLSCAAENKAYEMLCHDWRSQRSCSEENTNATTFDFTAISTMNSGLRLENCVNVKVTNVTFKDENLAPNCGKNFNTNCTISCPGVQKMRKLLSEININENHQTSTYQFHFYLWTAVLGWIGMSVVVIIADAICIDLLGDERKKEYGKQKMWGCIGFGIFCISSGYLVDIFSWGQPDKNYACIFYMMLIAMIFDMIASFSLRRTKVEQRLDEFSVFLELSSLGRERRVLVFIFWCIGAGMCTGVVWNFLFYYIEELVPDNEKDWIQTLDGLLTGVQCFFGELPFNFISGLILKKLGHINVMSLVLIIFAIRFMAYSLIKNPWLYLFVELLHGPTFGLSWPTMVAYGDKIAPSGTRATTQGLVGAVFEGIGVSTGSLICGYLLNTYGGVITFRIFSVGALSWLTIFWIFQLLLRKAKAFPLHQGHSHLASYATPNDAILMTMSQELQTY